MSRHHTETITCPNCNHKSTFTVWDSINTSLDPDMKQKVLTGEAFIWKCEECGYISEVCYATLYHQMENHIMIYCVYENKEEAINMINEIQTGQRFQTIPDIKLPDDYIHRVVGSKKELQEKIMVFDENLDDHVIELMKLYMTVYLKQDNPDLSIDNISFDVDKDGKKIFLLKLSDNTWASIDFIQELYDSIHNSFKDTINYDKEIIVDLNWAKNAFRNWE